MNREEVLEYVEVAAHNRIKDRCKYVLDNDHNDIDIVKSDIEYYQSVMRYLKENLR